MAILKSSSENGGRRVSARLKQLTTTITITNTTTKTSSSKEKNNNRKKRAAANKSGRVEKKPKPTTVVDGGGQMVVAVNAEPNAYARVTETLRTFNKRYLHFVKEEEKRCVSHNNSKPKQNETVAAADITRKSFMRPDLKAATEMRNANSILYPERRIGHIPGIDVGHQFFSRSEMVVLGFHQHWLKGIDFIPQSSAASLKKLNSDLALDWSNPQSYKGLINQLPLTTSIVLSGQYEDDVDNCDDIEYTGQGGNDLLGKKHQICDQVMNRGNLGLKNCIDHSVPIRVIRGRKCKDSYVGKVYTYDGLYKVVSYKADKGVSGFTVYKFKLKRCEGQPALTTNEQVQFTRGCIPKSPSYVRGLICEDITGGLEDIPIPVTNMVEDPPISPPSFTYIKDLEFSKNINIPTTLPKGCKCVGGKCTNSRSCACAKLNGGDFPYVQRDGGRLVEPRDVVFECGPNCGCGPECINKISQRGLKYRLEVYRTPKMGWGVRSWDYIPSGAPICEYIGLVKRTDDLDHAADNTYVFDVDCLQTMKGLDGRETRLGDVSLPSYLQKVGEEASESVPFCIDAGRTGNVARFINHSCQPNLFVQCMLSNHHDIKLARVILVAADNIPPLKELTYDYGYALDSVIGPDGKIQQMPCFCGAQGCRKRLY